MPREAHEYDPPVDDLVPNEDPTEALEHRLGDELKHLIQVVHFGHEMELFSKSKVGAYLIQRAEGQLNEATRQLLDMNSLEGTKPAEAHMKAKVAIEILRWINEAIDAGKETELSIQGMDAHEG